MPSWLVRAQVATFSLVAGACGVILGIESPLPLLVDTADTAPLPPSWDGGGEDGTNISASRYPAAVRADSPILYFRFGERDGSVARDEMERTNGTYPLVGVRYGEPGALAGDPDTSIRFVDGSSGITIPPSAEFPGTAAFSVEIWLDRVATPPASFTWAVDHEKFVNGERDGWMLAMDSTAVSFERYANKTTNNSITSPPLTPGWHHVVATFDGAKMRIFVDAARVAENSGTAPVSLPLLGTSWTVGEQNCSCSGGFTGVVDELAIYDYALSETHIRMHYDAAK